MSQTNNEKQNTDSVNSNKIIIDANHGMHAPATRDGVAFHFSFFRVINAGSLSNGDKNKNSSQQMKKTENTDETLCKNKCHCKVQQKQIHDKKWSVCHVF